MLAYQIARAIPAVHRTIEHAFECDPIVYTQSTDTQALRLIAEPLQCPSQQQDDIPSLIFVDALDECTDRVAYYQVFSTIHQIAAAIQIHNRRLIIGPYCSYYTLNNSPETDDDSCDKTKRTYPLKIIHVPVLAKS
ncbi:unnamed protein product [Cyclocybe aegerita]|uniref:Nephrocystin 3-like N-terminal domain-containing protein n=1 Tax=Cyclocybe aegerita TaxID=1973307 RepID=A0A8S0WBS7_CYCAE|nr:unnamed protein product [Cyclocybe aegerita]